MRASSGFTLIELILAISLMSVLLAASGVLMGRGLDAFNLVSDHSVALEEARFGLLRMEKELELVTDIQTSQSDRLAFTDSQGQATDFRLVQDTLMRGNDPLVRNVTGLNFTYWNSAGATTIAPPQVRLIGIDLTVQAPRDAGQISFRTQIFPRNFAYDTFE